MADFATSQHEAVFDVACEKAGETLHEIVNSRETFRDDDVLQVLHSVVVSITRIDRNWLSDFGREFRPTRMPKSDPYRPPVTAPSSVEEHADKHVANGCAIVSFFLFGFGVLSIGYAGNMLFRYYMATDSEFPRPSSDVVASALIALFGGFWVASGVLAYKMEGVWSSLLFIAGIVLLVVIAKVG